MPVYAGLAATCAIGLLFSVLVRDRAEVVWPMLGLATAIVVCGALIVLQRRGDDVVTRLLETACLALLGAALIAPAWLFGSNTELTTLFALVQMLLGVSLRPRSGPLGQLPGWTATIALATSTSLVVVLVALELMPNTGLVPVPLVSPPSMPAKISTVVTSFAWNVGGFLAGRRFRARYDALAREIDESERAALVRDALLEEARHDYMRALGASRTGRHRAQTDVADVKGASVVPDWTPNPVEGWDAFEHTIRQELIALGSRQHQNPGAVEDEDTALRGVGAATPQVPASIAAADARLLPADEPARVRDPASHELKMRGTWAAAYRQKLRVQQAFMVLTCLAGLAASWSFLIDPVAFAVAAVGMTLCAAMAVLQGVIVARTGKDDTHWPWVVVALASTLVSFAYGIHSTMSSLFVVVVFLGGIFRGSDQARGINRRSVVLLALCGSQLILFALVFFGVMRDHGYVQVIAPRMPSSEPWLRHVVMQGAYIASFITSGSIDRAFRDLTHKATRAAHAASVEEALLAGAGAKVAQLEAAMSAGLFAGQTVGRFELAARRASGGMGDVYDATDKEDGTRVAVKLMRVEVVSDPAVLELFSHEVNALQRVNSPYVARVLDAGGLEAGLPYVAMELIDGPSLADLLRQRVAIDEQEVRALVRDVARGLSAIHAGGVVHRDIKPQNILKATRAADATWKIVDLGIAHIQGSVRDRIRFQVVGTPRYMAPEQFSRDEVDGRVDVYALALVVYRLVTGRPAFKSERGRDDGSESPLDPSWLSPMHPDLALALRLGTASRPADRFASADAMLAAFEAAFEGRLPEATRRKATELLRREPWSEPARQSFA